MAKRFQFDAQLTAHGPDLRVTYEVTPFVAATYWQPAEGGECEIISVKLYGKEYPTSAEDDEYLLEMAQARAADDWEDERAAEADWRYQEYRDRLLMEAWERDA